MTCDDYQIAYDQQQAGATAATPAAELDAHVAACATCTAYVALSEKVSTAMMTTLAHSPAPLDTDAFLDRIGQFRRQAARTMAVIPLLAGVITLCDLVSERGFTVRGVLISLVSAAVGAIAGYGVLALILRRRISGLKALERRSGDALVAGLRAELDHRIRTERQAWWLLPLLLAVFHLTNIGLTVPALPYLVLEIACLAIPLPITVVRYRRLVRERALLSS